MSQLNITHIVEDDFPSLVSLFREFAEFEKLPEKMLNSVEKMKQQKEYINGFTVKNEKGEIVGYVTFFFAYYTWTGKCLYMDDLYVCESYRGQGIGSVLIKQVIAFAREQGCYKLRWQVSDWNKPAIEFYKSLGAELNDVEINCDLILK